MSHYKEMVQVVAEMSLLSYGQTMRYDKSLGEGERLGPPGDSKPEHDFWILKYQNAKTDGEKEVVVEGAKRALQAIKVRQKPLPPTDPEKERLDRIASQSVGTRDIDVATSYGMSLARVHKMRRDREMDPLDGTSTVGVKLVEQALGDKRVDAMRLRMEGKSIRQIAMFMNVSKSTVHRLLREAGF